MFAELPLSIREQIERAVSILKQGELVAFPTDTVYGLGAGSNLDCAVEKVYQIKGRPQSMALPLLLADISQISEVAQPVSPVTWLLVRSFLPGALTLVLPKSESVSDIITAGGKTVAVRIPAHPVSVALAKGLGTPIVGTSANLSGKPSALTADEVYAQFDDKIGLVIDGGRCPGGIESTVVDVTGETPAVLREGAISREELEKVCGHIAYKEDN
jgi:L-threonylcarbamoyladenylate synthase